MRREALAGGAALLWALAPGAWACGACAEDKIAATYDHAVVQKARVESKVVVFCELNGSTDTGRLRRAVARGSGIDPASVRVSANPAALSFALDTAKQSPQAAVAAIVRSAPRGTRLAILRVMGAGP